MVLLTSVAPYQGWAWDEAHEASAIFKEALTLRILQMWAPPLVRP